LSIDLGLFAAVRGLSAHIFANQLAAGTLEYATNHGRDHYRGNRG